MEAGTLSGFTVTNGHTQLSGDWTYERSGGGVWLGNGAIATHCTLTGNSANQYGGGSYRGTLTHCTLSGNTAYNGAGSFVSTLTHCTLSDNSADNSGGGSRAGTLSNCLLTDNSASTGGGSAYGTLHNCTLSGNEAFLDGGGSYYGMLNNSIIYGNTAGRSGDNWLESTLSHCCVTPLSAGNGNIDSAPDFVDPANQNYRFEGSSPCINAGDNALASGETDLYGLPRILGNTVDMGAYEYLGPAIISITNETQTVHTNVTAYTLGGTNTLWVVGTMVWTNAANRSTGTLSATSPWEITGIPLEDGENSITVSGTNEIGDGVSDQITVTRTDMRAPDLKNLQTIRVDDVEFDLHADFCAVPDADPYLLAVAFLGDGETFGKGEIRLRMVRLTDGQLTCPEPSILVAAELPDKRQGFPRIVPLENQRVLITWAEFKIDNQTGVDDYIIKGVIYDVSTGTAGTVVELQEKITIKQFHKYTINRVGLLDNNKLFFTFSCVARGDNGLDEYPISAQLFTYDGLDLSPVGTANSINHDPVYTAIRGTQLYSFPESDKFFFMAVRDDNNEWVMSAEVFQLDESETNGFESIYYKNMFHALGWEDVGYNIEISGIHGNSVESTSKVLICWWNTDAYGWYSMTAHLSDDNVFVKDSSVEFDPSVTRMSRGTTGFVENREYAWVAWKESDLEDDLHYNLLDLSTEPSEPCYPAQKIPREVYYDNGERKKEVLKNEFRVMALPEGDALFLTPGIALHHQLKMHYLPVPAVSLAASDAVGGEYGDTNLTFTLSRSGEADSVLEVDYATSGTVSNGVDIHRLAGIAGFIAGNSNAPLAVSVLPDNEAEGDETLTIQLLPGPGYKLNASSNATVTISDRPLHEYLFQRIGNHALSNPDQDADGDGVLNIAEYYMMTSPTNRADHAALITDWEGCFKLRYPRGKTRGDVVASFMWCRDLSMNAWHESGESDGTVTVTFSESIISDPSSDPETVELRVETSPALSTGCIFVRMLLE